MAEEIHHPDGRVEHPSVQTEKSDASFTGILIILLTAMAFAAIIHGVLLGYFFKEEQNQAAIKKSPFPLAPQPSTALPPEPRLEPLDRTEGIESSNVHLRLQEKEQALKEYGTTDVKGYVRIPVSRAMDLLAGKLPARPAQPAAAERKANGLMDSGESNSGRMYREKPRWWSAR